MTIMEKVINGFSGTYMNDKDPWAVYEIERQFDIEFNKRRTHGIWENVDYVELQKQFVNGIIKKYSPIIKDPENLKKYIKG